jgi:hypothetical protein
MDGFYRKLLFSAEDSVAKRKYDTAAYCFRNLIGIIESHAHKNDQNMGVLGGTSLELNLEAAKNVYAAHLEDIVNPMLADWSSRLAKECPHLSSKLMCPVQPVNMNYLSKCLPLKPNNFAPISPSTSQASTTHSSTNTSPVSLTAQPDIVTVVSSTPSPPQTSPPQQPVPYYAPQPPVSSYDNGARRSQPTDYGQQYIPDNTPPSRHTYPPNNGYNFANDREVPYNETQRFVSPPTRSELPKNKATVVPYKPFYEEPEKLVTREPSKDISHINYGNKGQKDLTPQDPPSFITAKEKLVASSCM